MSEPAPERTMAVGPRSTATPSGDVPGQVRTFLYRDGLRERETDTVQEAHREVAADPGLMVWVEMKAPNSTQLTELARTFGLPALALEDTIVAHQRPKAETYGDVLYLVLRPAEYDEVYERIGIGEVHLFASENVAVTIGHTEHIDLENVRQRVESEPRILRQGTLAVVHGVLDAVVDAYAPAVSALQQDIDELETQVFDGDPQATGRVYRLTREVILLQRAVDPLGPVLQELMASPEHSGPDRPDRPRTHGPDPDRVLLHHHMRDVADHVTAAREHVDGFRQLLEDIMSVNNSLIDQDRNEAMKKISSWGGILVVPALIASFYGMNNAPEDAVHWVFSWPVTLVIMVLSAVALYGVFRRYDWL
ncbi:magnesium and cobalt transport protein CorA [Nocardiopsis kunsanensis]|uniref:magnesium and cobalt transport protein CorA n=1 Tax=Nocardiopsis kunsanensis TaxID=141693 RepID=UPI00034AA5AD|nr:magnesium and cobalt transport protein CorA [Nocardiopsis kunsanensis]